ncbi:hypothetical protein OsJ_02528 [Oryza sativa Japonica Group]|uniref:Uncharacterized protein n=1 Tax=Oryza sativa subsp. japonica TaxID=39947 RepID=A2ZV70_ORYSJ|nr:hypothetical protein OsJ_02528 [Oryza sativa Japonica Group]
MSLVSSFMASLLVGGYAYIDKTDGAWMNLKTDRALRQRRAPIGGVAGGVAGGPGRVGGGAGVESGDGGGGDRGGRRGGGVLDGDGDDPCPRATSADASEPSEADPAATDASEPSEADPAATAASASSAGRFDAMRCREGRGSRSPPSSNLHPAAAQHQSPATPRHRLSATRRAAKRRLGCPPTPLSPLAVGAAWLPLSLW